MRDHRCAGASMNGPAVAAQHDCRIAALILTHGHWDHLLDAHQFAAAGIPVYGHRADVPLFEAPSRMASFAIPGLDLQPVAMDHWLEQGQRLDLLGVSWEVRHVPGTVRNILVYLESEQAAIVGDAIFAGSVGRSDLPGGDGELLARSIQQQIYTLPVDTPLPGPWTHHDGRPRTQQQPICTRLSELPQSISAGWRAHWNWPARPGARPIRTRWWGH